MQGKVRFFLEKRGFGFIDTDEHKDIFVHYKDLEQGNRLHEGETVEFELMRGSKGLYATAVRVINDAPKLRPLMPAAVLLLLVLLAPCAKSFAQQPAVVDCGTGYSLAANASDGMGEATVGKHSHNVCTIRFAKEQPAPLCLVTSKDGRRLSYKATADSLTVTAPHLNRSAFTWVCFGPEPSKASVSK